MPDRIRFCQTTVRERMEKREPIWKKWTVKQLIGSGETGCVFLLERFTLGQKYLAAMKVVSLAKSFGSGSDGLRELQQALAGQLNEISVLYKLGGHANVVHWKDHEVFYARQRGFGIADVVIRMEYLPLSLAKMLEDGPLGLEKTLDLARGCLNGLSHIHDHGILHMGIKPENIFFDEAGQARIGDFGQAKAFAEKNTGRPLKGSPLYAAPELVQPATTGQADQRADIYSMGLVVYEMLEGGLPFFEQSQQDEARMLAKRLAGDPFPFDRDTPEFIQSAIIRACSPDPDKRFATSGEFAEALGPVARPERPARTTVGVFQPALSVEKVPSFPESAGEKEKKVQYLMDMGDLYNLKGRWEEAANAFEELLGLDPRHPTAGNLWKKAKLNALRANASSARTYGEMERALEDIRENMGLYSDVYRPRADMARLKKRMEEFKNPDLKKPGPGAPWKPAPKKRPEDGDRHGWETFLVTKEEPLLPLGCIINLIIFFLLVAAGVGMLIHSQMP